MKFLLISLFLLYLTDGRQTISVRVDGEIDVRWLNIFKPKKVERRLNYNNTIVTKAKKYKKDIRNDQKSNKYQKENTLKIENRNVTKPYKKVKLIHKPEFFSSSEISSSAVLSDSASVDKHTPFIPHRHKTSKTTNKPPKVFSIKERQISENTKNSFHKNLRRQEGDVIVTVTGRIYKKNLENLNKILNITDLNPLRSKVQFITVSYKEMLSNYLKTVRESNKWTDGDDANKVVLDTIEKSSSMFSTMGDFLKANIEKMKMTGQLRQLDDIDKRMAEIRKLLENEPKESYLYACQRLGICRHGQGFIMFAIEMFSTVLQNDNVKLKRFHDSFVAITRHADFSNIVNETFDTQMHVYIKEVYGMPASVLREMYEEFVKYLKKLSENRNIMYPEDSPVVVLVDILDKNIMPTEENKNEWEAFMHMITDWTEGRRHDIDVILQSILGHILMKGRGDTQIIEADNVTTVDFVNSSNKTTAIVTTSLSSTNNPNRTSEHENIKEETLTDPVKTTKTSSKTTTITTTTPETLPGHIYIDVDITDNITKDVTTTVAINSASRTYKNKTNDTPDNKNYNSDDDTTNKSDPKKQPGDNAPLNPMITSNKTKSETTFADYEETTCPHLASASFTNLATRSVTPLNTVATKTDKTPVVSKMTTIASTATAATTQRMMSTNRTVSSTTQPTTTNISSASTPSSANKVTIAVRTTVKS